MLIRTPVSSALMLAWLAFATPALAPILVLGVTVGLVAVASILAFRRR